MKRFVISSSAFFAVFALAACGGGGGSSSGGVTTKVSAPSISTTTSITTSVQAAKSVNASKTLATSLANGGVSFPSLGSMVGKSPADQTPDAHKIIRTIRNIQNKSFGVLTRQKKLAKTVAATETIDCADGGKMTVSDGNTVSVNFSGCKESSTYMNGSLSMPLSMFDGSSYVGTIEADFTSIDYNPAYTTKTYESVVNMTMTVNSFNEAAGSMSMSMNGYSKNIDYYSGVSDQEVFTDFSLSMTNGSTTTLDMTGSMSMDTFTDTSFKTIDTGSGMSFQNFNITEVDNDLTSTVSMSGKFAIQTTEDCINGTFDISTQTAILINNITGTTTAGGMTINGVVTTFNPDGTVTSSINGTDYTASYSDVCTLSF